MDFFSLVKESILTLTLNKLRTGLATLGIIIGIGSVIALVSLGQAGQKSVENQIQSLGSNLLTVIPGAQSTGGIRGALGGSVSLTYDDAKAIKNSSEVTDVQSVSPEISRRAQVTSAGKNTNTQVLGAVPEYAVVRKIEIEQGSFITQNNVNSLSKVVVLGPQVVLNLFGEGANPIGKTVRINGQDFRIIGTTISKGGSGFQNQDDIVFVPLTTAQKLIFGADYLSSISLEAKSKEVMTSAQNQVGYLLLTRHKLNDPALADFSILSQSDILGAASQVTGIFTALLSGIAAISLLVGGIGIMNIMLVTVTERTREIGLRKALGARKKTIVSQFLVEAVILTLVGGILGMLFGMAVSFVISSFMKLPFVLSLFSVVLAIGVSGGIGILFGWYPARKAANLQPIEALRYE
ncbi:MAG: ABC transporter permease [bacterium]|nr:ABC transporter permease [bacterium]